MRALILNSGRGTRMGGLTSSRPKCMTEISKEDTILSRQLKQLAAAGIEDIVITTGFRSDALIDCCGAMGLGLNFTFVENPIYDRTNYIYSIYCAREQLEEDILLLHGDLVFEESVLRDVLDCGESCMVVSSSQPLPEKDFKAHISEGRIVRIGVDFFEDAVAAQPLYKLKLGDWRVWLEAIVDYCESGEQARRCCYAENAFNEVSDRCIIKPLDIGDRLCAEIDDQQGLDEVAKRLCEIEK